MILSPAAGPSPNDSVVPLGFDLYHQKSHRCFGPASPPESPTPARSCGDNSAPVRPTQTSNQPAMAKSYLPVAGSWRVCKQACCSQSLAALQPCLESTEFGVFHGLCRDGRKKSWQCPAEKLAQFKDPGHVDAVRVLQIGAEGLALLEAVLSVQRARGCEELHRSRFKGYAR